MLQSINAQKNNPVEKFHPPVDIPMYLSGNFAELRSNHFHSGIDIRTQGVQGKKVYSIDTGWVSRIKIQANGYGRAIYINHPGGYTSVYGHLSSYSDKIDQIVKNYQYKNQTHTLDLYLGKNEIPVSKGEIIALSGNSGSSGGPHLHFEIRNSSNQHPLNVLDFGFNIKDSRAPKILGLYMYGFLNSDKRRITGKADKIPLRREGNVYYRTGKDTLIISKAVSFGIESYDYLDGSNNRCGLYTIEVFVNNEAFYSFKTDEFSFAESRYINSHVDFRMQTEANRRIHNLFSRPNESLSMVKYTKNDGILIPSPDKIYQIRILLSDVHGNKSELKFALKGGSSGVNNFKEENTETGTFQWDRDNELNNHLFHFYLPANSLYEDCPVGFSRIPGDSPVHPWEHIIGDPAVPLQNSGDLSIKIGDISPSLKEKLCIVHKNKKGIWESLGGKIVNDIWIKTQVRTFGSFSVMADTLGPEIRVVNLTKNADLSGAESIRFLISDKLSGIDSYKAYIDNEWALFEYDPKNDLLYYIFDKKRLKSGQKHELELYVTDKKDNTAVFHGMFYW